MQITSVIDKVFTNTIILSKILFSDTKRNHANCPQFVGFMSNDVKSTPIFGSLYQLISKILLVFFVIFTT